MPKDETSSQLIAVRDGVDQAQLAKLEEILRSDNPLDAAEIVTDPAEISRQMRIQLLDAQDDDELEGFGDAISWGDIAGVPVEIQSFKLNTSEIDGGTGFYFVVFGNRMDTGERVVLTSGSDAIMAQIVNLAKRRKIPGCVRILEVSDKPTKSGFRPHKLVSTPEEIEARKRERLATTTDATE